MGRRATWSSQRGLLLLEAGLSAVVIAVGLVFISRGLTNQLGALRAVGEYETLLSLAHGKLSELEAKRLEFEGIPPPPGGSEGSFETSGDASSGSEYQWTVSAARREDLDVDAQGQPLFSEVTLTVRRLSAEPVGGAPAGDASRSPVVVVSAIWPAAWVPAEWYS
jgi:hypothetical protein